MLSLIGRRILYAIPIALGVSIVCFSLVYLAPGDPLSMLLPPDAGADAIALIKHAYGFDRPVPVQYVLWLWRMLHGDFEEPDFGLLGLLAWVPVVVLAGLSIPALRRAALIDGRR